MEPFTDAEFETQIRPLLATHCLTCHGTRRQEGGLRLDNHQALLRGGDSGPAVVPANSGQSLLMQAVRREGLEMPPDKGLSNQQIRLLQRWIDAGANWPKHAQPIREAAREITPTDRQWWAFQTLQRPQVPDTGDVWPRTPIDQFVLQTLQSRQLTPAPRAEHPVLVRRLYLDLTGLPPGPDEVSRFAGQVTTVGFDVAWTQLIDQLLASPAYGEHWARFWLDLVRYAESDGWNQDAHRPAIWRYRDSVINAFNSDRPWPEFVREQLAGDEIPEASPEQLAAAGFLRLGVYEYNQRDARGQWNDIMNEMTDVAADAFLGISMACARCHDHKFDPLLQTDYYRFRAFFEPVVWRDDLTFSTPEQRQAHAEQQREWDVATAPIRAQIDALISPLHGRKWKSTVDKFPLEIQACFHKPVPERNSWEHQMAYLVSRQFLEEGGGPLNGMKKEDKESLDALQKQLAAFDHLRPPPLEPVMTVTDFSGQPAPTCIPDRPDEAAVEPGFPIVLQSADAASAAPIQPLPASSGRRTALARWISDARNPLTTRVIVNRIWQQHFGKGLAANTSDFGTLGQPPTHPALLDWLASEFISTGFRFKQLHRLILTSAVWQQSAVHPDADRQQRIDPSDQLLWRTRVRRLSAEQIRDAVLSCSGELQTSVGGPSVPPDQPRRAVYVRFTRNTPDTFLGAFDMANGLQSVPERDATTTPLQSLLLINGPWHLQRADRFAARIEKQYSTLPEQASAAIELAWGRKPTSAELAAAAAFLSSTTPPQPAPDASTTEAVPKDPANPADAAAPGGQPPHTSHRLLHDFCHVLLNSSEFLYVE
ncbi:MAG: PSD1 and planctomycete cytochrome C domain-containing protein [Planctomycetota bacterium]